MLSHCCRRQVAGTVRGITAVQLDTKLPGVDLHLLEAALGPAADARARLLAALKEAVDAYESGVCLCLCVCV
jgi:polyribonucleotide nucleotidyltransferase